MELFSNIFGSLENSLDYSSTKQKVISQNIANSDTPNYKAKEVVNKSFNEELQSSINAYRTNSRHFSFDGTDHNSSTVVTQPNTIYNNSGNSVDIDKEMADLATNQIYYNAVTDQLSSKFNSLQNVIRGGK